MFQNLMTPVVSQTMRQSETMGFVSASAVMHSVGVKITQRMRPDERASR